MRGPSRIRGAHAASSLLRLPDDRGDRRQRPRCGAKFHPMNVWLPRVRASVETMSPGYFSMVLATGILALAAHLLAVPVVPPALFALNWILFAIICVLALARLC